MAFTVVPVRYLLAQAVALLLLLIGGCRFGEKLPCSYWAREGASTSTPEAQQLQPRGICATRRADGRVVIDADHLAALAFSNGLAAVLTRDGWFYVLPDGHNAPVLTYDNGPDYFSEGLARTIQSGKVGFIDRNLSEVVPPLWDFAFPFQRGVAVVCLGCSSHALSDGDHSEMRGGSWGRINRVGDVVVPVRFERDKLPEPTQ